MTELGQRYDPVDKPSEPLRSTAEMGGYVPKDRQGDPPEVTRASWVHDGTLYPVRHSTYFRDLLLDAEARERAAAAVDNPALRGHDQGPADPPSYAVSESGGVTGARERLAALAERGQRQLVEARRARRQEEARRIARGEQRDVSSTDGSGGQFVPSPESVPAHLAQAFAFAARDRGVLARILPALTLPPSGLQVSAPRFASPADTTVHSENTAVTESSPGTDLAITNVAMISGQVDVSREALERSEPGLDTALSAELGRAFAETIDEQLVNGSGGSDELTGLLQLTGISTVTFDDTSPTPAKAWARVQQARSEASTAYGQVTNTVLAHPRRESWLHSDPAVTLQFPRGSRVEPVPNVPVTLGDGGDEDALVVLDPDASPIAVSPPRFAVYPSVGSDTATIRLQTFGYVASFAGRNPSSVAKVVGSGLVAPTF